MTSPVYIRMMFNALDKERKTFAMLLADVTQEQAQSLTDGPDGWSILTIMCHLRDYQQIYSERLETILSDESAEFKLYDRMELIETNDYANQNLQAVVADYSSARDKFMQTVSALSAGQWQRGGQFPDGTPLTALQVMIMTVAHDNDHIEQVMRVLAEAEGS